MRRIEDKDLDNVVLRHQLEVLHRQKGRPRFQPQDRMRLPALPATHSCGDEERTVWIHRDTRINPDVVPTEGSWSKRGCAKTILAGMDALAASRVPMIEA
jgi:hypothetical protein